MVGGASLETEREREEDWPKPSVAEVRLVDAPVLFFVATHKAFRAELASLRRVAAEAVESNACRRDLVVDLRHRLEFLQLVYKYHSAAEDEVRLTLKLPDYRALFLVLKIRLIFDGWFWIFGTRLFVRNGKLQIVWINSVHMHMWN